MKWMLMLAALPLAGCATGTADVAAALEKIRQLDGMDERNDTAVVIAYDREVRRMADVILDYENAEDLRKAADKDGKITVNAVQAQLKTLQQKRDAIMAQWSAKLDEFMARPERERKARLLTAATAYVGALDQINQQIQAIVGGQDQ